MELVLFFRSGLHLQITQIEAASFILFRKHKALAAVRSIRASLQKAGLPNLLQQSSVELFSLILYIFFRILSTSLPFHPPFPTVVRDTYQNFFSL